MSVGICTADRYAVGMYGLDVCMTYLECAKADFGTFFLQTTCGFLAEDYTSEPYTGTDPPIYFVIEKEKTGSHASSVYKSSILHALLIIMVLKLLAQY